MRTYEVIQSNVKGFWNVVNEAGQMVMQGIRGKVKAKQLVKELEAPEREHNAQQLANFQII